MERFIPVEVFLKKSNTFRAVLPVSRFYRNDGDFLYRLFGLLAPGFISRESKNWYFVNGTTQSRSCFRCQQRKYQYHLTEVFTEISLHIVSAQARWQACQSVPKYLFCFKAEACRGRAFCTPLASKNPVEGRI